MRVRTFLVKYVTHDEDDIHNDPRQELSIRLSEVRRDEPLSINLVYEEKVPYPEPDEDGSWDSWNKRAREEL